VMALAAGPLAEWERARLEELHRLVQSSLINDELTDRGARNLVERKRAGALQQSRGDQRVAERLGTAPWRHVLAQEPAQLVQQARLIEGLHSGAGTSCSIQAVAEGRRVIELVSSDRPEALADATGVLLEAGVNVVQAAAVVWDRARVLSFVIQGAASPATDDLEHAMRSAARRPLQSLPMTHAEVVFDNDASPWYTLCDIRATDRQGLLHAIVIAAAASGVDVRAAQVRTESGRAVDHFELVDQRGNKLNARSQGQLTRLLRSGTVRRKRSRGFLSNRPRSVRAPVPEMRYPDFRNP
jgi:UTP:GlnB (protein PII) uridylyltransferase